MDKVKIESKYTDKKNLVIVVEELVYKKRKIVIKLQKTTKGIRLLCCSDELYTDIIKTILSVYGDKNEYLLFISLKRYLDESFLKDRV